MIKKLSKAPVSILSIKGQLRCQEPPKFGSRRESLTVWLMLAECTQHCTVVKYFWKKKYELNAHE